MNSIPSIAITGATGFLGSHLVEHFASKGWRVIALVRNTKQPPRQNVVYAAYDLSAEIDPAVLAGVDYLVHAAYVKADHLHPDAFDINIKAAERILAASRKQGLRKNVFISSMSAHQQAISAYGQQKLRIESMFDTQRDVSLRPGLIMGDGGIVGSMVQFMRTKHAVPLVQGGKQPVQIISIEDVTQAIENALISDVQGVLTVAHPAVYSYRQFYKMLADSLRIRVLLLPVPYWLIMGALTLLERVSGGGGIGVDSLRGLIKLQRVDTKPDLARLNLQPKSLEACLAELAGR